MALSTKIIKKRIRSIGNTKKITKAMEMVSAAKMRRSVNAVLASRNYATTAWDAVTHLMQKVNAAHHPLLQPHETVTRVALILISSNKGLCGGFNSHVINTALEFGHQLTARGIEKQTWITMGKKGAEALARAQRQIDADFVKPEVVNGSQDIMQLSTLIINGFLQQQFDEVYVIYTDFVSPLKQDPTVKQLLPLIPTPDASLGQAVRHTPDISKSTTRDQSVIATEYIFEPDMESVLNQFLPRLVEIQLYQALLESTASEHSARMMAMKNANESAGDMISELTLIYNQARQASITREIAEISGGKAAIEG